MYSHNLVPAASPFGRGCYDTEDKQWSTGAISTGAWQKDYSWADHRPQAILPAARAASDWRVYVNNTEGTVGWKVGRPRDIHSKTVSSLTLEPYFSAILIRGCEAGEPRDPEEPSRETHACVGDVEAGDCQHAPPSDRSGM